MVKTFQIGYAIIKAIPHNFIEIYTGGGKMDLIKIGNYLSELRRAKGLTQEELGEKLGVTNKTVSRWETGTYLPPAESLLKMSELYSVSINEILSGKKLDESEYIEAAEENLKDAVKRSSFGIEEKVAFYRKKWYRDHVFEMVAAALAVIALYVVGFILDEVLMVLGAGAIGLLFVIGFNNRREKYIEDHIYGNNV